MTVPTSYSQLWPGGEARPQIPRLADERSTLTGYLDWQRATFELKCRGVAGQRLSERTVPPSSMSLHGLLRHLSGVERYWFQQQFLRADVPMLYYTDEDPDQDFESLDGDIEQAFAIWHAECARSREIVAAAGSLADTGRFLQDDAEFSLRWLMLRMIAEYARHNGHADLLRERIDGTVGH
ncbi:MAG TPA: DinB family protein [Jatrophihabitans sp.]|jgi:hypothetical protein|nr:DinB family protein [Jatrophihabitans sp.]